MQCKCTGLLHSGVNRLSASVQVYSTQQWTHFHNKAANCSSCYLSISLTIQYFWETLNRRDIKINPDKVFLFLLYYKQSFLLMWDSAELSTAVWVALAVAMQGQCQVCGKQSCIYRMPHVIQTVNVYSMSRFFLNWLHAYPHSTDAIHTITNAVTNISDVQQNIMNFWRHNANVFSSRFNNFNTW